MPAPVLHTPRLTLRGHVLADLEALCDLFETDRARFMGGPLPRKEAWRWIASEVGMWDLRGFGYWGIETRDGSFVGQVGLSQPALGAFVAGLGVSGENPFEGKEAMTGDGRPALDESL